LVTSKVRFTGATQAKRGKFERADEATLFLDEVGDMSLKTQSKVLRALRGTTLRAGRLRRQQFVLTCVVIAATNKKLEEEIERGRFRADFVLSAERHPI
jgi:two-component system nitrogen regulation response regulator NtrX